MADLSIIIVNWNVRELLRDCLAAIHAAPDARMDAAGNLCLSRYTTELWVVDNASTDGSVEIVREQFPGVEVIASERNLGFTGGNNAALQCCTGRYVLLLNPDTRVVGRALSTMLDYLEEHGEVGVLGPQLRYPDGRVQSSRRRFPTLMTALMESTLLEQWFPGNRWASLYRLEESPDDLIQEVGWVVGACILVRREAIQGAGLLDEGYFMYSEEMDWCRRIVQKGWRVVYLPTVTVVHYEGQSSGQVQAARHIHFQQSKIRYFRKHLGLLSAGFLRFFLLMTYVYQIGEETAKYLIGHKRALRRERIAAYWQVLRSGLRARRGAD